MVKILIKRLSNKVPIPKYETKGSSGMDISAFLEKDIKINFGERKIIPTGISIAIPEGFEVQIRPRSGLAAKKGITVLNSPGTIDADYRGEIKVILVNLNKDSFIVENNMRIAQIVVCPVIQSNFEEVKELPDTTRGSGGFGSTGTK
ncbi:MAG: dUTP pyrophosphatase [Pelagibacterales bacterium]|jgi:dUTP pyrophosphatase|nr:dUTP pyrophosphatase [Pelagibacterales bacterium]|tara:strand:- start:522 stop:962 length:441 start_codon:yes stop_codon:yes gene_type:complete